MLYSIQQTPQSTPAAPWRDQTIVLLGGVGKDFNVVERVVLVGKRVRDPPVVPARAKQVRAFRMR